MQKTYPVLYNQNDYQDLLGSSKTVTIAQGGCFVSSFSMKASFYGHTITPPQLNQLFLEKGVYMDNDLLPDNALAVIFPDIHYIKTLDYEPIPTDLGAISNFLADAATTVTIRINLGSGNYHFVEAVNCDGHSLHIANTLSGTIEDFSQRYGNPVTANLHVIVYTGPIMAAQTPINVDPQTTSPSPLAMRFNQAITKATNFDAVADYLGISATQRISTNAGSVVVEIIKQLQQSLHDQQTIDEHMREELKATQAPTVQTTTLERVTPNIIDKIVPTPSSATTQGAKFANGSSVTFSTPVTGAVRDSLGSKNLQNLPFLQKIWKNLSFWLG